MQNLFNQSDTIFNRFNILKIVDLPGYPLYPPNNDIYKRATKVEDIDFEDVISNVKPSKKYENSGEDDPFGSDLDVPGADLDDENEDIGNEDEENNSYSLAQDEQTDPETDEE